MSAMKARTITITEREFIAIVNARVEIDGLLMDQDEVRGFRDNEMSRDSSALSRVIEKWRAAK